MIPDLKPKDEIHLRRSDVRPSRLIEVLRDNLIAAEQARPAIGNSLLISAIFFTYCLTAEHGTRMGFEARSPRRTSD